MTCAPLSTREDLKVLIREGIAKLCPLGLASSTYGDIWLCLAPSETGTNGHYLLVGLMTASGALMRLRHVFLSQPDFVHKSPVTHIPWFEPPFLPPTTSP
jgi:hypothetical protein